MYHPLGLEDELGEGRRNFSSVASPICQEGQSERTFPICPLFSQFFLIFSRFLANFLLSGWHCPLDPPVAMPLKIFPFYLQNSRQNQMFQYEQRSKIKTTCKISASEPRSRVKWWWFYKAITNWLKMSILAKWSQSAMVALCPPPPTAKNLPKIRKKREKSRKIGKKR